MSRAAKRGYNDFDPSCSAIEMCPYKYDDDVEEYLDGWLKADLEWEAKQDAAGEEDERFKNLSYACPWYDDNTCRATDRGCSIDVCAVYYFIKEL